MESIFRFIKKIIPRPIFSFFQPFYHHALAFVGACVYRFPSRHIKVFAVTGTKGKSTTVEIVNAIFEEAGWKTAVAGTVRFKIGDISEPNLYKMTIPGRFFVQHFIRRAVDAQCDAVILEMTSEGAKQFRHSFIEFDGLIFTNLAPEHIESHGGYEKYRDAKLSIARAVSKSSKLKKLIVSNTDDKEGSLFLQFSGIEAIGYSKKDGDPISLSDTGSLFTFKSETIHSPLRGIFNVYNMIGSATLAFSCGVNAGTIKSALEKLKGVRGRVESITLPTAHPNVHKQTFEVIVDYAHTPDSLQKLYEAFPHNRKICILGNTGGGRDKWKRPAMGAIAETFCDEIILTNEDPYDENPDAIISDIAEGIKIKKALIILDRRLAIATAISHAQQHDAILISGKGTDPYIMEANGKKTPWDDAVVVREELEKRFH